MKKILDFGFLQLLGWSIAPRRSTHSKPETRNPKPFAAAFSLVEVLAAVAIIGIITFLALPNIVRIKSDSEESLAIARAEAINLAVSAYMQAHGQTSAASGWSTAGSEAARYTLLQPYLAYAPSTLTAYTPGGYTITLPTSLPPSAKAGLSGPSGSITY